MFKIKKKLRNKEINLIKKLKSNKYYYLILPVFVILFSPAKNFIVTNKKILKKTTWIISYSIYRFFNFKVWYIDDFILHKKLRWKWIWKKLFSKAEDKIKETKCNYALLISDKKRKESHNLYKKAWYNIINIWLFILAYKKINNKK